MSSYQKISIRWTYEREYERWLFLHFFVHRRSDNECEPSVATACGFLFLLHAAIFSWAATSNQDDTFIIDTCFLLFSICHVSIMKWSSGYGYKVQGCRVVCLLFFIDSTARTVPWWVVSLFFSDFKFLLLLLLFLLKSEKNKKPSSPVDKISNPLR